MPISEWWVKSQLTRLINNVSNGRYRLLSGVHVESKTTLLQKYNTMKIINKITGRDVSREYLALMKGIITRDEFELITLTIK